MKRFACAVVVLSMGCTPEPRAPDSPPASDTDAPVTSANPSVQTSKSPDVQRGVRALEAGDVIGAKSAFEAALAADPKQADAQYYLGLVLDHTDDRAGAEKHYKAALEIDPGLLEAAQNLTALYIDTKRYREAAEVAQGALAKHPKAAELHLNYGVALAMTGDEGRAGAAFDEALKLAPNDPRIPLTYGQQLAAWKKRDAALVQLRRAESLAKDDVALLTSIGFELRGVGAFEPCVRVLDRAMTHKDIPEIRTYRALCKLGLKDKPGAEADLRAAIGQDTTIAPPHYYLGGVLADSGKLNDAIGEWETYLRLAPDGPLTKNAEAKIQLAKSRLKKK